MAHMADAERVLITHDSLGEAPPVSVTRRAYERMWKSREWTLVTEDLGKLSKAELVKAAEVAGVDTSGTKDEIIARLENQES